jgi:hypothetical protein
MHQKARTRWTGAVCALLLVTTTAGAQGFSCLDVCTNTFGDDIIVNGARYALVECSAIYHNGHHHVDCTYAR